MSSATGGSPETGRPRSGGPRPVMHIGEVAARTELSLRSLRHWEEVGLLTPSGRTEGGFRLYTEDDVDQILAIRRMKPLGFSLDTMRSVLADLEALREPTTAYADRRAARERLEEVHVEARQRRERLVRQVEMADELIAIMDDRLRGPSR